MKIYAVKAKRKGGSFSGRFKAENIMDATDQALEYLKDFGENWDVTVSCLKNQALAIKQFDAAQAN